jgi:hypothetical protein
MTFIFGAWTVGAALLFSAVKNVTLIQMLKGEPGEGQPSSIVEGVFSRGARPSPKGGQVGSEGVALRGLYVWTNPDGSKVPICKWIASELKRVGFKGHIESGYRSKADQARVCATGVKPCATPGKSRHQGKKFPNCAIDVPEAEAVELDKKLRAAHSPLKYAGNKDPVHFSHPYGGSY